MTDVEQHHDRTRQEQTFGDVMHGTATILIEYLIRSMQEQEKCLAEIMISYKQQRTTILR